MKKKRHSKLSKNEPVCMCKEGVSRIREGRLSGWGGMNCLKYLKSG